MAEEEARAQRERLEQLLGLRVADVAVVKFFDPQLGELLEQLATLHTLADEEE